LAAGDEGKMDQGWTWIIVQISASLFDFNE